jgi:catalase
MLLPSRQPKALEIDVEPEVSTSPALSLFALPGEPTIRTRRVAILVANGVDGAAVELLHGGLIRAGAVPRFVGARLGTIQTDRGDALEVESTMEATPSALYDATIVLGGREAITVLSRVGHAAEFLKDQYRHNKTILALDEGTDLLEGAGILTMLSSGAPDPGLLVYRSDRLKSALAQFIDAVGKHRHFARETDPPIV